MKAELTSGAVVFIINFGIILGAGSIPAGAECTYIVSPTGNDSNDGTSPNTAFATPERALQASLESGVKDNVICLREGSYPLSAPLRFTQPATLQSYPAEWAVITADNTEWSTVASLIEIGEDSVTIRNMEIVGGAYYGIKISPDLLGKAPANDRILNCRIHDTGRDGVKTYMADGLLIEGNEIYNTGMRDAGNAEGIDVMAALPTAAAEYGVRIRGNYIHDIATNGLYLKGGTRSGWVENNRVDRTGGGGIGLGQDSDPSYMRDGATYECTDCTAINNIVTNTTYFGLGCWASFNSRFENNTAVNVAMKGQAGLFNVPNSGGTPCTSPVYRNNVVSVSSTRPLVHLVRVAGAPVFDYNAYHSGNGAYSFWIEEISGNNTYGNYSNWQNSKGNDLHSLTGQLELGDDLAPLPGSPVVDRGAALPEVLNDCTGVARPQGVAYDVGAFEGKPVTRADGAGNGCGMPLKR